MSDTLAAPQLLLNDYDVEAVCAQFPGLQQDVNGHPLVYLDTAASAQKPQRVIDRMAAFYAHDYANIHRGVYDLSQRASDAHDAAREAVRRFINAAEARSCIFVRNGTEAMNLVAESFVADRLGPGDAVLITGMEHHANVVPWLRLRDRKGITLKVAPLTPDGALDMEAFTRLLNEPDTKFVGATWVSNALGSVNPVKDIVRLAHERGVPVMIDACQAVQHLPIDVQDLDCDFLAISGHKIYGPSGVGVLYGKAEHLEAMPPYQTGGDMILSVSYDEVVWNELPYKFEAGTPDIAGAVGLHEAIDFVTDLGIDAIARHEAEIMAYAVERLAEVPGLRLVGNAPERCSVLSFVVDGAHPHDIGTLLDLDGIAVRAGFHCAQPTIEAMGLPGTVRASIGLYTTKSDIDRLVDSLKRVAAMFA